MYNTLKSMLEVAKKREVDIAEVIIENEIKRFEMDREKIIKKMGERRLVMKNSIKNAIEEDSPKKTFITGVSKRQMEYTEKGDTICGSLINNIMAKALSPSEVNASMGKICAMPTAGSCGIVPAVLESAAEHMNISEEKIIKAYIVASGVGAIVAENASVSGAEGGCQAECGVAAGMAAAGVVYLKGGSSQQCIEAFSIAIVNVMGLVCDPVAGLVQIPCAQRNASQSVNALLSADLSLGGMKCGIEPDEVIEAMYTVGKLMPIQHRETSLGGIAITASGKKYEEMLKKEFEK